jgi:hypothetical protein
MTSHTPRVIVLVGLGVALLVASHGFAWHYVSTHPAMSTTVLAGVVLVALLKHLGLLVPLYAKFRRRQR